jgi:hypothetical protein
MHMRESGISIFTIDLYLVCNHDHYCPWPHIILYVKMACVHWILRQLMLMHELFNRTRVHIGGYSGAAARQSPHRVSVR